MKTRTKVRDYKDKLAMAMFQLGVVDAMLENLKGTGDERIKAIEQDREEIVRGIEKLVNGKTD